MTRIKKYSVVASAALAVAAACLTANALASTSGSAKSVTPKGTHVQVAPAGQAKKPKPAPPVRVVTPGERIDAGLGVTLWLTEEGKHWLNPDRIENFRSVVDGNQGPESVSLQEEPAQGGKEFLSGVYIGRREAARVVFDTERGKVTGRVVTLAGHPGWAVVYADAGKPKPFHGKPKDKPYSFTRSVTVYDAAGKAVASLKVR